MPRAGAKRIWGRSGMQNGKRREVMDQREIPSLSVRPHIERTCLGETDCKQVFSKEEMKGRQGKGSGNK